MKRLTILAAALATLFLAGSCRQENLEPEVQGKSVTFTVEAPAAVQTRAIADGLNVDQLIYEVWLTDGEDQRDLSNAVRLYQGKTEMVVADKKNTAKVTVDLLQDQHYTVLFWAHVKNADAYNTEDLRKVTYRKELSKYAANDESLAAFYAVSFITDGDPAEQTVTLTRPFAQLNLGTLNSKADNDGTYTIALDKSKVQVSDVPTVFNVATSEVSEPKSFSFALADVPAKTAGEEVLKVRETEYQYAGMNYVFAGDNVTVTYVITTKLNGTTEASVNNVVENVPLQENYRTNIVGNLLTSTTDYEIVVDADFDNEGEGRDEQYDVELWDGESSEAPTWNPDANDGQGQYEISTPDQLAGLAALINGTGGNTQQSVAVAGDPATSKYVLTADINLDNRPWTPIGFNPNESAGNENYFSGIFDGNGYTIHNLKIDVKDQGGVGLFGAVYNATIMNLTLKNVDIKAVESENNPANSSGAEGVKDYIAGGHTGAVVGYDAKAGEVIFENVHVTGIIKIEGETRAAQGQRIGGIIGGRGSSKYTFRNVSVVGDDGSYIKGYCSTAGVIGQAQEAAVFENVHTDIDVYAVTFGAGGIAGIARQGSTFTDCSSSGDITLDASKTQLSSYSANYPYRVGGIAGCWSESAKGKLTLTDCSYTGTLTSIDRDGNHVEAFDYAGYVGRGYTLKNCAGSEVIVNGTSYVQADNATYGVYIVDGVYEMNTVADLKWLGKQVTAKNTFKDQTVKLTADIDLGNEQWIPIGNEGLAGETFNGVFDGNGKTISNLKRYSTEEDYFVGLFGCLGGATIKDLTITNVDINLIGADTFGHIGAVAGWAEGATSLVNVIVNGDVKIEGEMIYEGSSRIGAVIGGNQGGNVSFTNVKVNANEGSFVRGNNSIGGIAGQLQGEASFENCSSNINVTAQKFFAGGIIGLAPAKTTFTNCSTSGDVSVLAGRSGNINDFYRVGGIAGGWDDNTTSPLVLEGCSYTGTLSGKDVDGNTATGFDCAGFVGRGYSAVVDAKVIVNGSEYTYLGNGSYEFAGNTLVSTAAGLKVAISEAQNGDVIYLADGEYDDLFHVGDKSITLKALNSKKAEIAGRISVAGDANSTFTCEDLKLAVSENTNKTFGNQYYDKGVGYIIGIYCGNVVVKNCEFNGMTDDEGAITYHSYASGATTATLEKLTVENCVFNGGRAIRSRSNVSVTGCTFTGLINPCLQVLGLGADGIDSKVVFTSNTSDVAVSGVCIKTSNYPTKNINFNVGGNTNCNSISFDEKNVNNLYPETYSYTGEVKGLTPEGAKGLAKMLSNDSISEINLVAGAEYDLTDIQYIKHVVTLNGDATNKPVVKGKLVAEGTFAANNIRFEANAKTNTALATGTYGTYVNNGNPIVVAHKVAATFDNCEFFGGDNYNVGVMYFADNAGKILNVKNCTFTKSYIYSKTLCKITNNKFDLDGCPYPLCVWPCPAGTTNNVCEFVGNTVTSNFSDGKANCHVMLLSQSTPYRNTEFNVSSNIGDSFYIYQATNAVYTDPNTGVANDGSVTFAEGSMKFMINDDGTFGGDIIE